MTHPPAVVPRAARTTSTDMRPDMAATAEHQAARPQSMRLRRLASFGLEVLRGSHYKLVLVNLVGALLPTFVGGTIRARLYRLAGFDIGAGCSCATLSLVSGLPGIYARLHLGKNVLVADHVTINLDDEVWLGRNVSVSPHVRIYTGTHQIGPGSNRKSAAVVTAPVTLDDGCWVGIGATILPGVTVGRGSIVGAGSVVKGDVPPNTYVEGNPARVMRALPWGDR